MKIKDTNRSMMHSYDELRTHFPYLIPQQTAIQSQPSTMSAACHPEYAHPHTLAQFQVPYATYPAYVSAHPVCGLSSYVSCVGPTITSPTRLTNSPHTAVSMSSNTSAFQPVSHSSLDRNEDELTLQKYTYDY